MTLDNPGTVEQAVVGTTDGIPGARTYPIGIRIRAANDSTYGYGAVNAVRAVTGQMTTTGDIALFGGAAIGVGSWVAGNYLLRNGE